MGLETPCDTCEDPPELTPYNQQAYELYRLVCDQVRPTFAGWPPLDTAAVGQTARDLGFYDDCFQDTLERVKKLHELVGETANKNVNVQGKKS